MSYISMDELDQRLNQGMDVYQHYYPKVTGKPLKGLGKKMISPFIRKNGFEEDPSFSIFIHSRKGKVFFKDHGNGKEGTHYQFVMDLFGLDFRQALEKIKSDLCGISSDGVVDLNFKRPQYEKLQPLKNTRVEIVPGYRDFTEFDLNHWSASGISRQTLDLFHCRNATHFDLIKENKTFRILEKPGSPIYNFSFPSGRHKMCQPFAAPEYKWTSNLKADEDIFGFDLIPKECEHLFMIGGNSDAMSFFENMEFPVMALASESANLTEELFHFFKRVAKNLWVFYDNDPQGYRKAEKFKQEFGLRSLNHLLHQYAVKDFRQLVKEQPSNIGHFKKNLLKNINKVNI